MRISVSLRPSWSTERIPGQPSLPKETVSWGQKKKNRGQLEEKQSLIKGRSLC